MAWNLIASASDSGPWALLIVIGGIVLIGSLAWDQLVGAVAAIGLPTMPGAGFGVFLALVLIGIGIALWATRNR